jgi:N-acetylmuramoyl-L-alanine amidase
MTNDEALQALLQSEILGLTMFGEARGDSRDGSSVEERIAVGCVVRNRLKSPARFGASYKEACLKKWQFSCWLPEDPNSAKLWELARMIATGIKITDPLLNETLYLASGVEQSIFLDRTGGATHYYAPLAMVPKNRVPNWAVGREPVARIGTQLFFKGV